METKYNGNRNAARAARGGRAQRPRAASVRGDHAVHVSRTAGRDLKQQGTGQVAVLLLPALPVALLGSWSTVLGRPPTRGHGTR